jgi:hypothetical protein
MMSAAPGRQADDELQGPFGVIRDCAWAGRLIEAARGAGGLQGSAAGRDARVLAEVSWDSMDVLALVFAHSRSSFKAACADDGLSFSRIRVCRGAGNRPVALAWRGMHRSWF